MKKMIRNWLSNFVDIRSSAIAQRKIKQNFPKMIWELLKDNNIEKVVKSLGKDVKINCYTDSRLCYNLFAIAYEEEELDFIKRFIKNGDVFLDIGSNVGLYSLITSPLVGNEGIVYAFEPDNKTYNRLLENIDLNSFSNIKPYNLGFSEKDDKLKFTTSLDGHDAWNSFGKPSLGEHFSVCEIEVTSLDSFLSNEKLNTESISLIKIDVEGWEKFVISGAESLLNEKHAPTLLVEFSEENLNNAGYTSKDLFDLITSFGYSLYTYSKENHLKHHKYAGPYDYVNFICSKDEEKLIDRLKIV